MFSSPLLIQGRKNTRKSIPTRPARGTRTTFDLQRRRNGTRWGEPERRRAAAVHAAVCAAAELPPPGPDCQPIVPASALGSPPRLDCRAGHRPHRVDRRPHQRRYSPPLSASLTRALAQHRPLPSPPHPFVLLGGGSVPSVTTQEAAKQKTKKGPNLSQGPWAYRRNALPYATVQMWVGVQSTPNASTRVRGQTHARRLFLDSGEYALHLSE